MCEATSQRPPPRRGEGGCRQGREDCLCGCTVGRRKGDTLPAAVADLQATPPVAAIKDMRRVARTTAAAAAATTAVAATKRG